MTRGHFETTYLPFRSRARDLGIATLTMHHGTVFGRRSFCSELSLSQYIYIYIDKYKVQIHIDRVLDTVVERNSKNKDKLWLLHINFNSLQNCFV